MGSLFGGKTKSEQKNEATFNAQFQPLIQQQAEAGRQATATGQQLLGQASTALQGPLDYWKTLASGDRTAISNLLGPQLDSIAQRSAQSRNAISQFANRGTPMSDRLGELSSQESSDINQSILGARPEANQQLSQLAQLLFGTGTSVFSAGTGTSGNALQDLLGYRSGNMQSQQLRQAGNQNIFRLIPNITFGGG